MEKQEAPGKTHDRAPEQWNEYCADCGRGPFTMHKEGLTLYAHGPRNNRCPGTPEETHPAVDIK